MTPVDDSARAHLIPRVRAHASVGIEPTTDAGAASTGLVRFPARVEIGAGGLVAQSDGARDLRRFRRRGALAELHHLDPHLILAAHDTLQSRDAILVGVILGESEVFAHLAGRHEGVFAESVEPDKDAVGLHLSNRGAMGGVERGRFVAEGRASSTPTTIRILQRRRFGSVRVEILARALIDESHRKTHARVSAVAVAANLHHLDPHVASRRMKIFHRHHFRVVRVLAREGELVRDLGAVHEAVASVPVHANKDAEGPDGCDDTAKDRADGGGFGRRHRGRRGAGTAGASLVREARAGCVRAIATATVVATAVRSTRAPRAVPRGAPRAASRAVPRGTPRARVLATRWRRGIGAPRRGRATAAPAPAAPAPRPGRTAAAVAVAVAVAVAAVAAAATATAAAAAAAAAVSAVRLVPPEPLVVGAVAEHRAVADERRARWR